jgi:hypothetical protein
LALLGAHHILHVSRIRVNEEDLDRVCCTREREVKCIPSFDGKSEEKDCLEKLDGATLKVILKCI